MGRSLQGQLPPRWGYRHPSCPPSQSVGQAGRQADRERLCSKPTGSLQDHLLTLSFVPTPFLAPGPRTSPSIPHTATNTKARAEKRKMSPVRPQERHWGPRRGPRTGRVRTGSRGKGWREGHSGPEGTVHQPVSPLQTSSTVSGRKKKKRERKKVFGFLASAGHHCPRRAGRRVRATHGDGGPYIPGASDTEAAATVNDQ